MVSSAFSNTKVLKLPELGSDALSPPVSLLHLLPCSGVSQVARQALPDSSVFTLVVVLPPVLFRIPW